MLASDRFPWLRNPQGPNTLLDRLVYAWCSLWCSDIRQTWQRYQAYYRREYVKHAARIDKAA